MRILLGTAFAGLVLLAGLVAHDSDSGKAVGPQPVKVAFIGDSGFGSSRTAVLQLIASEGADAVMHQGDFDYVDDPASFFASIDSILGPDFPFFAAVGNHDAASWPEGCGNPNGCYASFLKSRMARLGVTPDDPDLNDQMYSVTYRGLKMVFVGDDQSQTGDCDTNPNGYACFIRNQLSSDSSVWKICSWHKNQNAMQVGDKSDAMGWAVYENCKNAGAIIATAHEHSYQRTRTLLSMQSQTVDTVQHPLVGGVPSWPDKLKVTPGASFAFVSGLGGQSMREQTRCLPSDYPYGCNFEWGDIFSLSQTGLVPKFGALFIEFGVDGNPNKARGYFKTTDGEIVDSFEVVADPQPVPPIQAAFFYPWFPNSWTQGGTYPYTNYTPSLGFYSSTDDATIDQQLLLAKQGHIEAFIASWWGQGHRTDTALQHILARSERIDSPYAGLRWGVYYEAESYSDPPASQIAADLQYLAGTVFNHPGYLRVDGRPVVFVYSSGDGPEMASRWKEAKAQFGGNVYIALRVYSGYRTDPNQPDSWHQYGPASAYDSQVPYSVSISPGFWKKGETPRLGRDPSRFESDVQRMAASGAFWQLITTWNEWGEGTSVEPAAQFGRTYVDILCRNIPGDEPCATSTPTPTPTPTPDWDDDEDGFADGTEVFIGTDPLAACPTVVGAHDAWPPDFDQDQHVDIIDVLYFAPVIASIVGDPRYDPRFDLDANEAINIIEVLIMAPFMMKSCAGP